MMKTTMNIPNDLLEEAVRLTRARTKTEAVIWALRDLVRRRKIERLISQTGKLEFSDDWEEARHAR
ncbi:MAG: type II toxin-antitoxin system VapB family antitoxin [Desulfobacterota bacterium U4-17]